MFNSMKPILDCFVLTCTSMKIPRGTMPWLDRWEVVYSKAQKGEKAIAKKIIEAPTFSKLI